MSRTDCPDFSTLPKYVCAPVGSHANESITKDKRYAIFKDGCINVGGNRAWRNNNPGDLTIYYPNDHDKDFCYRHGAVGNDDKLFAIFPDAKTGEEALKALLKGSDYQDLTIHDAIWKKFSGDSDEIKESYVNDLGQKTGLDTSETKVKDLNDDQFSTLWHAIENHEGFGKKEDEGQTYSIDNMNGAPDWVKDF
jgi:hypothetical protein